MFRSGLTLVALVSLLAGCSIKAEGAEEQLNVPASNFLVTDTSLEKIQLEESLPPPIELPQIVIPETIPEEKTRQITMGCTNIEDIIRTYPQSKTYIPMIKESIERHKNIYEVPLSLAVSLKLFESTFDQYAISWCGAAGLTQLMPETAQDNNLLVYKPAYFDKAWEDWKLANLYETEAIIHLKRLEGKDAIENMKKSSDYRKESRDGFAKYKNELENKTKGKTDEELMKIDQRFVAAISIDVGIKHLAQLLKYFKGDIDLAICAYNAGKGPVTRATKWNGAYISGIPPIPETVHYYNRIKYMNKKLK